MKTFHICALGASLCVVTFAADTKLKVEELPPAVQTAMKQQTKGATILGASKEQEHGGMTYEVETKLDGKSRDLTFAADGSLLEVEQQVDLDSLPGPAKHAIQKKTAHGTIRKVEAVKHGATTSYEAAFKTAAGKNQEVAVNADGSPPKRIDR